MFNPVAFYEAGKSRGKVPTDYILCYDFNGDVLDKSVNGLHGIKTGSAVFGTGAKAGTQCLEFTSGCVRTPFNLPVNSDKVTISFGMKTSQLATAVPIEMSPNLGANNTFSVLMNNGLSNAIYAVNRVSGFNIERAVIGFNGAWNHIIIEIDRSSSPEASIYKNGEKLITVRTDGSDNVGNFVNNILYIGQRNASTFPYVGSLQFLKIYNRLLNQSERLGLKNELL